MNPPGRAANGAISSLPEPGEPTPRANGCGHGTVLSVSTAYSHRRFSLLDHKSANLPADTPISAFYVNLRNVLDSLILSCAWIQFGTHTRRAPGSGPRSWRAAIGRSLSSKLSLNESHAAGLSGAWC